MCISEWARYLGISNYALRMRLKRWPIEKALTQGKGKTGRRPGCAVVACGMVARLVRF